MYKRIVSRNRWNWCSVISFLFTYLFLKFGSLTIAYYSIVLDSWFVGIWPKFCWGYTMNEIFICIYVFRSNVYTIYKALVYVFVTKQTTCFCMILLAIMCHLFSPNKNVVVTLVVKCKLQFKINFFKKNFILKL